MSLIISHIDINPSIAIPWRAIEVVLQGTLRLSKESSDGNNGREVDEDHLVEALLDLGKEYAVNTVIVSGSEPLTQTDPLTAFCFKMKECGWKVIIDTRYTWDQILFMRSSPNVRDAFINKILILNYTDFIVEENKLVDIEKTRKKGDVVYYKTSLLDRIREGIRNAFIR